MDVSQFLQIYFNSQTGTIAFSLIREDRRIWGIDFDYLRGWHLHPVDKPEGHMLINRKNIKEIIADFAEV